jgi:phosphoribosylanthranilate isomerase
MPTLAKICGLTTPEAVATALAGGASHIGFVLFDKSPRRIRAEDAARLAAPARDKAKVVALLVDPDDALVNEAAQVLRPDLIQLHGQETPARAAAVRALSGLSTIKAMGVREAADVRDALAYEGAADHLMFDAKPPLGADRPGGHGAAFDWTLLKDVRLARPWFLAGGLDPWNVGEAIGLSRAPMVDVSSGVERGPGLKDAGLIAAFLDAVRRA